MGGVERLELKDNHTWRSKPGYSICVIDRGLLRFDYPSHWIAEPEEGAVHLYNRPPAVENCDLGVSIFRVLDSGGRPRVVSYDAGLGGERKPYQQSEVHHVTRGDLEIAWLEQRYVDAEYKRDARFRVALARGPVLCLISMNYRSDSAAELEPVWDEVLRTLVTGVRVEDPTARVRH